MSSRPDFSLFIYAGGLDKVEKRSLTPELIADIGGLGSGTSCGTLYQRPFSD